MAGRGGGSSARTEGGAGQQHQGWNERSSASSSSADVGGRSPLKEAPAGNRKKGNATSKSRPHDVPHARNARGTTAGAGKEDKGITLRCMYTHQKTKKRKTWSDGAVKCCPKRQRVSLHRWSDALGVTDKLLGEIYLTAPQFEAFVGQGEPELEMETFLVSLDGVIQTDNGTPTCTPGSAGDPAESAAAGGASGGAGGVGGKKRKLFKAFKPPARRTPPPAPPSDGAWGPPPRRTGQLRNGEPYGDGRLSSGAGDDGCEISPRTSYTGFSHVESLWDDDEDDDDDDDGEGPGVDRGGDRAEPGGPAVEINAGWGMGAGAIFSGPHDGDDGGRGAGTFPGRVGGRNTSSGLPRSAGGIAGDFPARQDVPRFEEEDPAHDGRRQDGPSPYLVSLRNGNGGGAEVCPGSTGRSTRTGGEHYIHGAGGQGHYYPEHPQYDHHGSVAQGLKPTEGNAVLQYGGGVRAPEANGEPAGRDNSGGSRVSAAGVVEMRSTQDILSLFGGLEEDGDDHGSPGPRGTETAATPLQQSSGPSGAPAPPEATRAALSAVGGGMPRAADMRRAQKETRAAAGGATAAAAAAAAAGRGAVQLGAGVAPVESAAADVAPSAGWACGVCGVRGGVSATSCRVCGTRRQGPTDEGVLRRGADDHSGVVDDFLGSEHEHGWGGADCRGGEGWQEQEWEGVAGDGSADDGGGRHDDLGGGRVERILREEQDVAGLGHPSSPSCCPSSYMEREDGAEGVGGSFSSVRTASSQHRVVAGVGMQIDVGSSSDSDGA